MSYYSMWVMKPYKGKTAEAEKMLKTFAKHWKRHGAIEAVGCRLFGSAYGHLSLSVQFKNMESYGKFNDAFVADPKVQKDLANAENFTDVIRHTLARTITE